MTERPVAEHARSVPPRTPEGSDPEARQAELDRGRSTGTIPPLPSGERRTLRIAINADLELARETVCRLGAEPDRWWPHPIARDEAVALRVTPEQLERARRTAGLADRLAVLEQERAERLGLRIVTLSEPDYPPSLLELELPPPVLYFDGRLPPEPRIAVVGSRRADPWALELARELARACAGAGVAVVSGFARGVDGAAHRGAIEGGGATIAVLGCGLDVDYPRGHRSLGEEMRRRGGRLSEFPVGCAPHRRHFPIRNRLIAALGSATLVIQAAERSGSLITAGLALTLGREVFAVPGRPVDRRSRGANLLIRDGAAPVLDADSLLELLGVSLRLPPSYARDPTAGLDPGQAKLWRALREATDPASAEELALRLDRPVGEVLSDLVSLELDERVLRVAGGRFLVRSSGGSGGARGG